MLLQTRRAGALALLLLAVVQPAPVLTRGPYLQSVTATGAIIVWRTAAPGDSRVEYGLGAYTHSIGDPTPTMDHAVQLSDLPPGAEIAYRVLTNNAQLYAGSFRTAPLSDQPFSFGVIGDSGIGSNEQYAIADRLVALDPDFVLHTGDVIYPSGQADGYDPFFFQPYQALLRRAPIFPSLGNHDYGTARGQPYLEAFFLPHNNPANTERYYSFDWGNAHFTALDFNDGPSADQLAWLQSDLAATDKTWKFVFYHQAVYSSGPHGYEAYVIGKRAVLAPIFDAHEVDVVFNGHDHDYERTVPISDVVYIVSGGGGASLYNVNPQPFSAYAETAYHAVLVTVEGCEVRLEAVRPDGVVFDTYALNKPCPAPTPTPTTTPAPTATPHFEPPGWLYLPVFLRDD